MIKHLFLTLQQRPSRRIVFAMALAGFALLIPLKISVDRAFARSGYPVGFVQSQLSFSGDAIRSHFRRMNPASLERYREAQYVDYAFLIGYGFAFFSFSLGAGRLFREASFLRKSSPYFAFAALIAAICDALENLFILLMLSDPRGFPGIYAVIHSYFAAIKFLLIGASAIYIVFAITVGIGRSARRMAGSI